MLPEPAVAQATAQFSGSRTMVRWALLFLAVLAVAGAAAMLLLGEDLSGAATVVSEADQERRSTTEVSALGPTDQPGLSAAKSTARPLATDSFALADEAAPTPDKPSWPTRTVTGYLLRASDRSPLRSCEMRIASAETEDLARSLRASARFHDLYEPKLAEQLRVDAEAFPTATTDHNGHFALHQVQPQDLYLVVFVPTGTPVFVNLPNNMDETDHELLIDTGFIVEGSVSDTNGAPIEGALLTLDDNPELIGNASEHGLTRAWAEAITDSTGRFRLLDALPSPRREPLSLVARAPGYIDGEAPLNPPVEPSVTGPVDFVLQRSGSIAGTVFLDVAGSAESLQEGLARVTVDYEITTSHGRPAGPRLTAIADSAGRYSIDGVPAGVFILKGGAPGVAAPQWQDNITVTTGNTTIVDWVLSAGGRISGKVVDTGGIEWRNVPLRLEHLLVWEAPDASGSMISSHGKRKTTTERRQSGWTVHSALEVAATHTDSWGRYAFKAVPAGHLRVSVMAAPGELLRPSSQEIIISDQQVLDTVSFVMGFGVVLRGHVRDDLGRPLPGARVMVDAATEITTWDRELGVECDADGRFEIGGLAHGEQLNLWVSHPGHADHWQRLVPTDALVEIELKSAVILTGAVLVAETGLPVARYEVLVQQGVVTRSRGVSNPEGLFFLELSDDELVSITISAEGRRTTTLTGIRPSDSQQYPLEIRLPPGG